MTDMTPTDRTPATRTPTRRLAVAFATTAVVGLVLGACSSTAAAGTTGATAATSAPSGQSGQPGQGSASGNGTGHGMPGASGLVAAVSGSTAQVQGSSSQTAVSWSASTRFTGQAKVSATAIKVGDCVTARPAPSTTSNPPTTPTPTTAVTTMTATTVQIFPATHGKCSAGGVFGRGAGGFAGRGGGSGQSGATGGPSGSPTGGFGPGGGRAFNRGANGTVTAVSPTGFVVTLAARQSSAATGSGATTTPVIVTVTSATTFTAQQSVTASAVKVGVCVTAVGKADDTGAIAASVIAVSPAVAGQCTGGFGFARGSAGATSSNGGGTNA